MDAVRAFADKPAVKPKRPIRVKRPGLADATDAEFTAATSAKVAATSSTNPPPAVRGDEDAELRPLKRRVRKAGRSKGPASDAPETISSSSEEDTQKIRKVIKVGLSSTPANPNAAEAAAEQGLSSQPLQIPQDHLKDVSQQTSQSLGVTATSAKATTPPAVSPTVVAPKKVVLTGPVRNELVSTSFNSRVDLLCPPLTFKDLSVRSESRAVRECAAAVQQMMRLGSLARSHELALGLEGGESRLNFLEKKLAELRSAISAEREAHKKESSALWGKYVAAKKEIAKLETACTSLESEKKVLSDNAAELKRERDREVKNMIHAASKQIVSIEKLKRDLSFARIEIEQQTKLKNDVSAQFEEWKAVLLSICQEKWQAGYLQADQEVKDIVEEMYSDIDWDKFSQLEAARDAKKEEEKQAEAGCSGSQSK